nr:helicase-related protein [Paenibacillus mangrovi]
MRVDVLWWNRNKDKLGKTAKLVFLSEAMAYSLAVEVEQEFEEQPGMESWDLGKWSTFVHEMLWDVKRESQGGWIWDLHEAAPEAVQRLLAEPAGAGRMEAALHTAGVMEELGGQAALLSKLLHGRSLLAAEVESLLQDAAPGLAGAWFSAVQLASLQGRLALDAGVAADARPRRPGRGPLRLGRDRLPRCRRCGSEATGAAPCAACGRADCAYCEACLALGRSRACSLLLRSAAGGASAVRAAAEQSTAAVRGRWGLSAAQGDAACAALGFLAEPPRKGSAERSGRAWWPLSAPAGLAVPGGKPCAPPAGSYAQGEIAPSRFLLWAVTGAGKTEMIFPLLSSILEQGGRVLVATPRRDVVLELAPRLAKAFEGTRMVTLYGGSTERWQPGDLTLATTHQLMRFYRAFDLVIIDELDAFPYHNDPMLAFAAQNACKPDGKFVYLSATPPRPLQKEAARGTLHHAKVPVRFHGHPLPVPKRITMKSIEQCLRQPHLLKKLTEALRESLERDAQVFLFVSRIRHIDPLVRILGRILAGYCVEGTSSEDPQRAAKVTRFRGREIRLLVTTTILERGVTVPRSDVFIADADSGLFDEASLVQMAGRAGRSSEDPAGKVIFASPEWTHSQKRAVKQITSMNLIARKNGYLKES